MALHRGGPLKGSDERPIPSTVAEAAGHASPAEVARRYTTVGVDYADATRPAGYERIARFRGGEVWTGHGESKRDEVVVVALPHPGDDPEAHNCDAMGCGTDHVIARVALRPRPDGDQVAAFIEGHARRVAELAGEDWEGLSGEERDEWASTVHDVLNQLAVEPDGGVRDARPHVERRRAKASTEFAQLQVERDALSHLNAEHLLQRDDARTELDQARAEKAAGDQALIVALEQNAQLRQRAGELEDCFRRASEKAHRLSAQINTPHVGEFFEAVRIEAAHQRERWGYEHDAAKHTEDWIALFVYLLGKAATAYWAGDHAKLVHHVVTVAAVASQWHGHLTGADHRIAEAAGG